MESFFHGKSSGLDPLNSYLSLPILISSQNDIEATGIPSQNTKGQGAVFLLDSGMVGETAPMVHLFMQKMKEEGFRTMLKNQFIKHTDACVPTSNTIYNPLQLNFQFFFCNFTNISFIFSIHISINMFFKLRFTTAVTLIFILG
jgi:mevalonate kinase